MYAYICLVNGLTYGELMVKTICIVQARMSSTRLPGKTMMDISGKPVLWHVIQRLRRSKLIDGIVVATSIDSSDDIIEAFCRTNAIAVMRGSLEDVLDRYYQAAKAHCAGTIVRVTADCPLLDAGVIDELIGFFNDGKYDYASNNREHSYPHGLDAEVFTFSAIARAWKEARLKSEREHVTPYIWKQPDKFRIGSMKYKTDYSKYRWTLDHPQDLQAIRAIYANLGDKAVSHDFAWLDILRIAEDNPDITRINSDFDRLEGYKKSVDSD